GAKTNKKPSQILRSSPCLSQLEKDRSQTAERYKSTMRNINLGGGIVVAAIVIVVVALLLMVDVNRYRGAVQAQLERQLSRSVKLGRMTLGILPLRFTVEDTVIAADPSVSSEAPSIRAESLELRVRLSLLFD